MIQVENVNYAYLPNQMVLQDLSFSIQKHGVTGFLGLNGAGKSTTLKLLVGYLQPLAGNIFIDQFNLRHAQKQAQQILGYLPEHNPLYLDLRVGEYLQFVAKTYQINAKHILDKTLELVGLSAKKHQKIETLSKGYRQRVGLASALIHEPKILILDEPTTGLDPVQILEIRSLIQELGKTRTVLLSTHLMQEVQAICDDVLLLHQGKLRLKSSVQALLQHAMLLYVETDKPIAEAVFLALDGVKKVDMLGASTYRLYVNPLQINRQKIALWAKSQALVLYRLQEETQSIESIFQEITQNQVHYSPAL
jgi:ABC-2 type transport system ATP-binding protein